MGACAKAHSRVAPGLRTNAPHGPSFSPGLTTAFVARVKPGDGRLRQAHSRVAPGLRTSGSHGTFFLPWAYGSFDRILSMSLAEYARSERERTLPCTAVARLKAT